MPIISLELIPDKLKNEIIIKRKINLIFDEIGTKNQDEVDLNIIKKDRRELDSIIFEEVLGLSEKEQIEVYRAIIELVSERIDKAKSVKHKKSKRKFYEEQQIKQVLDWIGESKIDYIWHKYNPHIMSLQKESLIKIPKDIKSCEIFNSLFGWQIKFNNNTFYCPNKETAEVIEILAKMGKEEIILPEKNLDFSKDLEILKSEFNRIGKIIEDALQGVTDLKLKNRITHSIWENLTSKD